MAFNFDELKRRTGDLAQKGADWAQLGMNKAAQMAGVAKLKAANLSEEDTIRKGIRRAGQTLLHDPRLRSRSGICGRDPGDQRKPRQRSRPTMRRSPN